MKIRDWLGRLAYTLVQGSLDEDVEDVVYDSRKARPHTVFVCIRGSARDSHTFIPDVLEKGCWVLVTEKDVTVPGDVTVLRVENGRLALAELSAARIRLSGRKAGDHRDHRDQGEDHHQLYGESHPGGRPVKRWGSSAPMGLSSARKNMPQPTPPRNPIWYRNILQKWWRQAVPIWSWKSPPRP